MWSNLALQAVDLVQSLAQQCSHPRGFGSMSSSIYDTAWVSMIRKRNSHEFDWLFPECFECLLESQQADGAWESYASPVDGILNTAAALLALRKHLKDPIAAEAFGLDSRSARAEAALRRMLSAWDIASCDHVGFEVLVTCHLDYLEDEGIVIDLPVRQLLKALEQAKLAKLPLSYVETVPSTLIHSLEALVGKVDFDHMRHLRADGSMLASPSSTAAYLMNVSTWDHDSEMYLRAVLGRSGALSRSGLFPCAWPTTIFELAWVITALQEGGFSMGDLGQLEVSQIGVLLEKTLMEQGGVVGFTPFGLPDADDTARTILALQGLGRKINPNAMIAAFEGSYHFLTYKGERNPSFSTNCNVAACLLTQEDPSQYSAQIQKCIQFLSTHAFEREIRDKWNISEIYPKMLLSQTLLRFLTRLDDGSLEFGLFSEALLREEIPIITMHVLAQVLHLQKTEGSWGSKHEVTSYAVLALVALWSFPWMQPLRLTIDIAISRGKRFLELQQHQWAHGDYLWIEKVTYASGTLSLGYCLSAARARPSSRSWGPMVEALNDVPMKHLPTMWRFFAGLPLYYGTPDEQIQMAFIQSQFFLRRLRRLQIDIFPRKPKEDNYLKYVPFTWTACNNQAGGAMEPILLQEMIILSMLMYEADEFMETAVEQELGKNLEAVRALISHLCSTVNVTPETQNGLKPDTLNGHKIEIANGLNHETTNGLDNKSINGVNHEMANGLNHKAVNSVNHETTNGLDHTAANGVNHETVNRLDPKAVNAVNHETASHKTQDGSTLRPDFVEVERVLRKLIHHLLRHPMVVRSHPRLQEILARELKTFLLAHVAHAEDNAKLTMEQTAVTSDPTTNGHAIAFTWAGRTYYQWVRSTSADHTSCPFAFVFYCCLIAPPGANPFTGPRQMYLAEDMCRHLATMCRQYNDYGSVARDRLERNLNSIDFPEFHARSVSDGGVGESESDMKQDQRKKADLMWIAEYERAGLESAMAALGRASVNKRTMKALEVFVNVTDLYGQIYVHRDIGVQRQ